MHYLIIIMCNLEENGAFVTLWLFKCEIRRFVFVRNATQLIIQLIYLNSSREMEMLCLNN